MAEEEAILVVSHDLISESTTVQVESLEDDDGCPCYCHCSKEECFMKYGDDEDCDQEDKTVCHCWHNSCACGTMTDDEYTNFSRATRSAREEDAGLPGNN